MPTLEWIGKDKVINHHQKVPFKVLEEQYTYNAEKSENMIIGMDVISMGDLGSYTRVMASKFEYASLPDNPTPLNTSIM